MKRFRWIVLVLLINNLSVFSQEKFIRHTVIKGETISEIATKYTISPSLIYELNPDVVNGIKPKTVLLIPSVSNKANEKTKLIAKDLVLKKYQVQTKETIYGIAKQSKISVEQLYALNPELEKEGLKIGQIIQIPQAFFENQNEVQTSVNSQNITTKNTAKESNNSEIVVPKTVIDDTTKSKSEQLTHTVKANESLYFISKKYGCTLAELQNSNPNINKSSLRVGQLIYLPAKTSINTELVSKTVSKEKEYNIKSTPELVQKKDVEDKKLESEKTFVKDDKKAIKNKATNYSKHEVLAKESLYSISRKYSISLADLKKLNPDLESSSLKVGQKINIAFANDTKPTTDSNEITVQKESKEAKLEPSSLIVNAITTELTHEVLPKETKYGIAKQYGLTVVELEEQNPNIKKKLLVGSVLKIQTKYGVEKPVLTQEVAEKPIEENPNPKPQIERDVAFVDQLISKASENLGTRYRSGGTTTAGFDCSGLMCYTFANTDIKLPRSSAEMASFGSKVEIQDAKKGDLIFFKTRGSGRINHVGMVVEVLDGEIKFIHSATHGGVIISSTKESYYERNLVQLNRVL